MLSWFEILIEPWVTWMLERLPPEQRMLAQTFNKIPLGTATPPAPRRQQNQEPTNKRQRRRSPPPPPPPPLARQAIRKIAPMKTNRAKVLEQNKAKRKPPAVQNKQLPTAGSDPPHPALMRPVGPAVMQPSGSGPPHRPPRLQGAEERRRLRLQAFNIANRALPGRVETPPGRQNPPHHDLQGLEGSAGLHGPPGGAAQDDVLYVPPRPQ